MSVEIVMEGVLGKKFGKVWNLHITSPAEALRLIDANQPGLIAWIRDNKETYSHYRVTCEYANGQKEDLSDDTYLLERGSLVKIIFEVVIQGAGGKGGMLQTIVGVVLIVAGAVITGLGGGAVGVPMMTMGVSMMIGGVIQMLTPQPKLNRDGNDGEGGSSGKRKSSYFDGPANTVSQGNPVPLCYGTVLAGSQAASANLVIDQVL